ncbi:MAG TPA: hypothetical protein VMH61_08820 [Candidatus Acidoferrales bacterium]|nr:hypothetical protein [Candidatus Acidoferrales bacterium]
MRIPPTALLTALLLLAPGLAPGAELTGTLWVSRAVAQHWPDRAAVTSATRRAVVRDQRGVTDAVVWIEQIPDKVERQLADGGIHWFWRRRGTPHLPCLVQNAHAFTPHVLAVVSGTQVEFRNLDRVYHNAFSVSAAQRFDIGKYPPGRSDTVLFEHPGVVNLHCDIHPDELGFVVVTPNHASARPDSTGAFVLPHLPPGHYTARAWHPRLGETHVAFDVPKRGSVDLRLVL